MNPIYVIIPVFLIVFPLLFIGVIFLVSKFGWSRLRDKFEYEHEPYGENLGVTSVRIGLSNYNGVITIYLNKEGVYMRPKFIFKLFHPGILIPWSAFNSPNERSFLFQKSLSLKIQTEKPITITFYGKTAKAFIKAQQVYYGKSSY